MVSIKTQCQQASAVITSEELTAHIAALASDEFAGRAPAALGESLTIGYFDRFFDNLARQSKKEFLTLRQTVPAVQISSKSCVSVSVAGNQIQLEAPTGFVASSKKQLPEVKISDSQVIFVGYGIVAPEYGWDDFKDVNVTGKTLLVLAGDPILEKESLPGTVDNSMFRGEELTYYGRWTYKFEQAGTRGASAVFIIHETARAGYGWDVVARSFGSKDFDLKSSNVSARPSVEGWFHSDQAKELLSIAGVNLQELRQAASNKSFRPVPLEMWLDASVEATFQDVSSDNFIAVLPGSKPELAEESILYCAHWDHFGTNTEGVLSGAVDNASGVAGVLALAKAFACGPALDRSITFLLPTLEEQNLLGSRFYVENPVLPLSKLLACLNLEMLNPWGVSKRVSSVCQGHTSLDDLLTDAAAIQGRTIVPEPEPSKGYLYRSDHLAFMRAGIPSLALFFSSVDFLDKRSAFIANDYHKVTDKLKPDWNLDGAARDVQLFFDVGLRVLIDGYKAKWDAMSEFCPKPVFDDG